MDPILQTLFSWQFVVFGLAIAAIVFVLRKIAEYILSAYNLNSKESKLWQDLILPILPVVLGAVAGFLFTTYPYPDGLTTSGSRVIFGLVAGLLSTLFYRLIKSLLMQKITSAIQSVTNTTAVTTTTNLPEAPPVDDKFVPKE